MSLYFFNKVGNKILIHKTLISLTHLISMVMTQQDWTLAASNTAQNFNLSLITTMALK